MLKYKIDRVWILEPRVDYINVIQASQITASDREEVVICMGALIEHHEVDRNIFILAVNIFDRFLSCKLIEELQDKLGLIAITAVEMARKARNVNLFLRLPVSMHGVEVTGEMIEQWEDIIAREFNDEIDGVLSSDLALCLLKHLNISTEVENEIIFYFKQNYSMILKNYKYLELCTKVITLANLDFSKFALGFQSLEEADIKKDTYLKPIAALMGIEINDNYRASKRYIIHDLLQGNGSFILPFQEVGLGSLLNFGISPRLSAKLHYV